MDHIARTSAHDYRMGFRSGISVIEGVLLDTLLRMEPGTEKTAVREALIQIQNRRNELVDKHAPMPTDEA